MFDWNAVTLYCHSFLQQSPTVSDMSLCVLFSYAFLGLSCGFWPVPLSIDTNGPNTSLRRSGDSFNYDYTIRHVVEPRNSRRRKSVENSNTTREPLDNVIFLTFWYLFELRFENEKGEIFKIALNERKVRNLNWEVMFNELVCEIGNNFDKF